MSARDRSLPYRFLRGVVAACGFAWLAASAFGDEAAVRERFRAAYAAANAGPVEDDEELREYVLYPYLQAARIEHALGRAQGVLTDADAAAERFLVSAGGTPVARALRRAWLTSLARRASWQAFLTHYDAAVATPPLECQSFQARIATGDTTGLVAAVRARWLTGRRLPSECEPAFQWLRAQDALPNDLVVARTALLLDNGQAAFARTVAARLPREVAAPLLERADFIERPARTLDAWVRDPGRDVPAAVVLEAWSRLARNSPDEALARYGDVAGRIGGETERHALALALAKGLSWDRRPEALEYFARVPSGALDRTGIEWWARSALWAADWDLAGAAIAQLPASEQADWSWRYWTARVAERRGERGAARALYTVALGGDNYYSAMAAARLGESVVPRLEPIALDAAAVEALAALDSFKRARELVLVGLREQATNEWHYGYALLPEAQRLQAIHLAARWGAYDIAVATATSHGQFNDYPLLYPRPYGDEVAAAVKLTAVEANLLYGVLRQESLFRPDGASAAGAFGIAQLTHATARETARRWSLPVPTRSELFDPKVGIMLGAARVAELIERFDSQLPVALAAYNAGEAAAARWLPPRGVDSDVWIENIPYNETRAYVRRVLWHSLVFRWLETGEPQSAREWLGEIRARTELQSRLNGSAQPE